MFRRKPHPASLAEMAPEGILLAGAGCALLLQLARPEVGYGVAEHSGFAADPLKRLRGTLTYIYAVSNGSPAQANAARQWVDRVHRPVHSPGGAGRPAYDSTDPGLQLWVAATLYWTAMEVAGKVFGPLPDPAAEKLYRDYAVLGTALQMPAEAWPATRADFERYWTQSLPALRVDAVTGGIARKLLAGANLPWWARAAMPAARLLTAGFLPEPVRTQFALPWSPAREARFRRLVRLAARVYLLLPAALRHAPMRHYLRRLVV